MRAYLSRKASRLHRKQDGNREKIYSGNMMEIDSATLREINKKYSRNRVETDSAALREIDKDLFKGLFHRAGLRQVGLLGIFSNLACPPRRVFP